MKNQNITPASSQSWPWYKVWKSTLFSPNVNTGKALLSEGNISFWQAVVWFIVAAAFSRLITSAIAFVKNPATITLESISIVVLESFLAGMVSPFSAVILTGGIHLIAKLFRSKGTWKNFFIVWVAFNVPILILFYFFAFIYQVSAIQETQIFGIIIAFYWLFVVNPVAIRINYSFRWLWSFLINLFTVAVLFFGYMSLYITLNPGLFNR